MGYKILKRGVSLLMALMVFTAFTLVATFDVNAASGDTRTVYLLTSQKTVRRYADGKKDTTIFKRTYDKNGLWKSHESSDRKMVATRNKKGYFTKIKSYDGNGKLLKTDTYKYTYNKKGLIKTEKMYTKEPGKKKVLSSTYKYTYYSNGNFKTASGKYDDATIFTKYRKNGTRASETYESSGEFPIKQKRTFDKHGNEKKHVYDGYGYNGDGDGYRVKETDVHTTMSYDKNGNLEKDVYTNTYEAFEGEGPVVPEITKYTETTVYTYDSHKNIKKSVTTRKVDPGDGEPYTETITSTFKYKAVKQAKKYWNK